MDATSDIRLTRDAALTGVDPRALRRGVRAGELVRPHRGSFVDASIWGSASPTERYRARVVAAASASRSWPVVTHLSAAILYGAPLVGRIPEVVHVATSLAAGTRTEHGFRRHATSSPGDVQEIDGVLVTALARTLADVALTEPLLTAVAILDWALAQGAVTVADILGDLDRRGIVRSRRRAESALVFADARSGSAGESLSRVRIHELGFPRPELQHPFSDVRGLIGIVDFWWPAFRTVGEFDGVSKYVREEFTRGRDVAEIVLAEKRRENRLRALGLTVLRWEWNDAWSAQPLREILRDGGLPTLRRR